MVLEMPVSNGEPGAATRGERFASDVIAAPSENRRRGEGAAMAEASFRDPPDVETQGAELQRAIARALVNAPTLPIDLPAFDLTLLAVAAEKRAIDLVLGKTSPIAKLRLQTAAAGVRDAPGASAVVDVSIIEVHPSMRRFEPGLRAMAQRLRAAINGEKWRRAADYAQQLARIPLGVPIAFYRQLVPGVEGQGLIRVGFLCNQDCGICWQDRTWGRFDAQQVLTWIEDLHAAGARSLIISGGEPTLDSKLDTYICHARTVGFDTVTLETNAIQFSKSALAERLRDAGLSDCFVSLHSGDAATSDAITRAPGTFTRTVAGIGALLAAGVPVHLNCVMTREGIAHLGGVPDFVHSQYGNHPLLQGLMLSQPSDPYDRSLLSAIIPDPAQIRAVLPAVIDRAFALGLPVRGLDGPCGPPLCAFAADRRITDLAPISEEIAGRTYLPACAACAVRHACFGVRVADAEMYGDACVRPLTSAPAA
jgi:sulfatase maturation enzyme AslB (radical SAM superfamily)